MVALGGLALTLWLSLGLLILSNRPGSPPKVTPANELTEITGESLRTDPDLKAGYALAQSADPAAGWSEHHLVVIDIRPADRFAKQYLVGAIPVPVEWLTHATFDPQATIVIYTDDAERATQAVDILNKMGITDVSVLDDPLDVLKEQGHHVAPE